MDKSLRFGRCLSQHPYIVYTYSEGFGESAHLHSNARAFLPCQSDRVQNLNWYSKTCIKRPLWKNKIGFQYLLSLNAGQEYCRMLQLEHSAILLTFIKLPFVIKIIILSIFKSKLYTRFTLYLFLNPFFYSDSFHKHLDRTSMKLPIIYFQKSEVEISKL